MKKSSIVLYLFLIVFGLVVGYTIAQKFAKVEEPYKPDTSVQDSLRIELKKSKDSIAILKTEILQIDSSLKKAEINHEKTKNKPKPTYLLHATIVQLDSFWTTYK